jgi:predicted  nucleic acid-binding Zn-ribbon protein
VSARPQVVADVEKTDDSVQARFALKNLPGLYVAEAKKPLFAFVGAADRALAQAKEVPADVSSSVSAVSARLAEVPAQVRTLPSQVRTLRSDVEDRVEKVHDRATDLYGLLSIRGERLITSIRRQPATEAAIADGKEAVRKAAASATAAKHSAQAGEKAVQDAAGKLG